MSLIPTENSIERAFDAALEDAFDKKLEELILAWEAKQLENGITLSNADRVSPKARHQLKGLLRYYAKKDHPFAACVADNRKRFGPKAEGVCAVLKDIIRGTTKWRGKDNPRDHGTPGLATAMEELPALDGEALALVEKLSELDLWELLALSDSDGKPDNEVMTLAYPLAAPVVRQYDEADHAFLDSLAAHHQSRLKTASKYALSPEAHPDLVGIATDSVSDSARIIAQINRIKKTGRPY